MSASPCVAVAAVAAVGSLFSMRSRRKKAKRDAPKLAQQLRGLSFDDLPLKNDLLIRAARGEDVERRPVWIMRQAGRYLPEFRELRKTTDFFTMCRTPKLAMEVTLQPLRRFPQLDAVIIFSDILVVPQAMGMEVLMIKGVGPVFPTPLGSPDDLSKLQFSPDLRATLGYVLDALTCTRRELAGQVPLIGFAGGPWTLMQYMIEGKGSKTQAKAKAWLYRWPEAAKRLLHGLSVLVAEYMALQVEGGAQFLQLFETLIGELSPAQFDEFLLPNLQMIAARLADVGVPVGVFAKGAPHALPALADAGYSVLHLDWKTSPTEARRLLGERKVTLAGNMDPCALYSDKEGVAAAAQAMLDSFDGESHIAGLGHGMHPQHKPEAVAEFLRVVHEHKLH